MAQTKVLVLDEHHRVPAQLRGALERVGAEVQVRSPGEVLTAPGRLPEVTVLLASAGLAPHTVRAVARRPDDVGQQPSVVAFAALDLHLLDQHVLAGADYVAPPFHPDLVRARLRDCHERAEFSRTMEDVAAHAELLSYERELEIGREIQLGFLPDALP